MIKRDGKYEVILKQNMRDGEGEVRIEKLWNEESELKANNRLFAKLILPPGTSIGFHKHENEEEVFAKVRIKVEGHLDGLSEYLPYKEKILPEKNFTACYIGGNKKIVYSTWLVVQNQIIHLIT